MADLLTPGISKMMESGVFEIFIFVIVAAVFYAFLRKSKMLGDSPVVIGAAALSIGFLIFLFRWVTGTSLVSSFSILFTQWTTVIMVFLFGLVAASMFYPDMMSWLPKVFQSKTMLTIMITLGLALMITSGMVSTFWATASTPANPSQPVIPMDTIIISVGLLIFVVMLVIVASVGRG